MYFLFHCLILIIFTLAVSIVNIIVIGEVELECPARPEQIPELSYKHSCVTIVKKNIFSRKYNLLRLLDLLLGQLGRQLRLVLLVLVPHELLLQAGLHQFRSSRVVLPANRKVLNIKLSNSSSFSEIFPCSSYLVWASCS